MKALDTNVLVRSLVQDDLAQHRIAARVLEDADRHREQLYISLVVLCETLWVIERSYGYPRASIVTVVEHLLENDTYTLEHPELAALCLEQFRHGKAGFADYVIGALAQFAGCSTTYTFDRTLRGLPGFHLL